MDYNVLVLALSILPRSLFEGGGKDRSRYQLRDKETGELCGDIYEGLGQMEVTPLFIQGTNKTALTHIFVLTTKETKEAMRFVDRDARKTCEEIRRLYDAEVGTKSKALDMSGLVEISHLEFFERRMRHEGLVDTQIVPIDVDTDDPSGGLNDLQGQIRGLYTKHLTEKAAHPEESHEWNLWLDSHGGFRETAMAMLGLMQMLAAPDEQELAGYANDRHAVEAIKRLSDDRDTIPVTAVYGIAFDPSAAQADHINHILDRTDFFGTFTKPAVEAYMNFGQYAQMLLRSNAIEGEGDERRYMPYSFISYRRLDAPQERYAFIGRLKKAGYRYWYDDAIELLQDWHRVLKVRISECNVFIALITKRYFESYPCVRELHQALSENKPVVFVTLDQTRLSDISNGITVEHPRNPGEVVTIAREELARLIGHTQHLPLRQLINDSVLQESELIRRFDELSLKEPAFAATKIGS